MPQGNTNKSLVKNFWDGVWNEGKIELIDRLLFPNFIAHNAPDEMANGPGGYKKYVRMNCRAFPDGKDTIEDIVAEGDKVVIRYIGRGTHMGSLFGIKPTGKKVAVQGMEIFRVRNGIIVESWSFWDTLTFLQQIGLPFLFPFPKF